MFCPTHQLVNNFFLINSWKMHGSTGVIAQQWWQLVVSLQRPFTKNLKQISEKWNCAATFPIHPFMDLWAIYIFPRSVHLFYCSCAVSFLGIHKSNLVCSVHFFWAIGQVIRFVYHYGPLPLSSNLAGQDTTSLRPTMWTTHSSLTAAEESILILFHKYWISHWNFSSHCLYRADDAVSVQ